MYEKQQNELSPILILVPGVQNVSISDQKLPQRTQRSTFYFHQISAEVTIFSSFALCL